MRRLSLIGSVVVSVCAQVASAQGIHIQTPAPQGDSAAAHQQAERIQIIAAALAGEFGNKYPCAKTSTSQDVRDELQHQKDTEQRTGELDLGKASGMLDADYLVVLQAIPQGSQVMINATLTTLDGRIVGRQGRLVPANTEDFENQVADFAREFVESLTGKRGMSKLACPDGTEWWGLVRIRRELMNPDTRSAPLDNGKGSRNETSESSSLYEATIDWSPGASPIAQIKYQHLLAQKIVKKTRENCSKKVTAPDWRIRTLETEDRFETNGGGSTEASVSVSLQDGVFKLSVGIPSVPAQQKITRTARRESCVAPLNRNDGPTFLTVEVPVYSAAVDKPAGNDKNHHSGSYTVSELEGIMKDTISWSLNRVVARPRK